MKRILVFTVILILLTGLVCVHAQPPEEFPIQQDAIFSALYEADIATLREAIDLKLISCEALTAYYLERIIAYNQLYNCFITMCDDALDVARQRDQALAAGTATGSLFGIPIVIKDNMHLAGYHTTNGHEKKDSQIANNNATVVDYLLKEGAVIIAKANMSTEARSARDSSSKVAGKTRNAYNRYLSPAGSSGGSAVSTSLNFTVASLGTDTNSSLRLPAAYAGCVSLRATHGLISQDGIIALVSARDTAGAITRTVYDQAIMLDVLTGGTYQYTKNLNANALKGMRLGILKELCYPIPEEKEYRTEANLDPEITTAFAAAVEELRQAGAEVVEVSFPNIFELSAATTASETASNKDALHTAFQKVLEQNNVCAVIFPTYLSTPLRSGADTNGKYWNVWNQLLLSNCDFLSPSGSLPEITVPIGLHSLGCGIGMEIAAPRNQEQLLLNIAYSYTSRYNHRAVPTGAPNTYAAANAGSLREILDAYKFFLESQKPTAPSTQPPETFSTSTAPTTNPTEPTVKLSIPPTTSTAPTEATTRPPAPPTTPTEPSVRPTEPESSSQSTVPSSSTSPGKVDDSVLTWLVPCLAAVVVMLITECILIHKLVRRRRRSRKAPRFTDY